ncbi:MAG: ParB N-terminal domain-containing protein [Nitrospiraceae bacterium]|nr:ParB N-terminal domain-containing protein [Nitrospiraceae bacterium]
MAETTETMEQLDFKIPQTWERKEVEIDKIIIEEELQSGVVAPTYKSVSHLGMLFQEVVLVDQEDMYKIVAGRRRVQAARQAGLGTVPALVLQAGTPEAILATITVVENMNRRPNPAVEAESLGTMMAAYKWSQQDIADHLGIPLSHVKSSLKLFKLIPEFFAQLKEGRITLPIAKALRELPAERQRELLGEEKLTLGTVSGALRTKKLENLVPAELFRLPEPTEEETVDALIREAIAKLERAVSITRNGKKESLEEAIKALRKEDAHV